MQKRKIRAVVFDLYGTLIFIRNDRRAFVRFLDELGADTKEGCAQARRIAFTNYFSDVKKLASRINPEHDIDVVKHEIEIISELRRAECFSDTLDVLAHLKKKRIATGLISNVLIPYHRPFFDLGLRKLFDEYIFSCEVGLTKPDPEIYKMMLEKLGIDAHEVLMVGDSKNCDVDSPKAIGMQAKLIDRSGKSIDSMVSLHGVFPLIH